MQKINSGVTAPKGFLAGGVHCGVKTNNPAKKDIAIIYSEKLCTAAAVYTQNKVFGAPITVTRRNIADGMAQAVVCNSGNANTCNADGVEKAEKMCVLAAKALHLKPEDIIVASTGVIGQVLPIEPIEKGIAALAPIISGEGNRDWRKNSQNRRNGKGQRHDSPQHGDHAWLPDHRCGNHNANAAKGTKVGSR